MKYDKRLIEKAKGSPCKICFEIITESEADRCEFQAVQTSRKGFCFVHNKCWKSERESMKGK
jgi:hypothetical protein